MILSDSNKYSTEGYAPFALSNGFQAEKIDTFALSVKRNGYICTHKRTFC